MTADVPPEVLASVRSIPDGVRVPKPRPAADDAPSTPTAEPDRARRDHENEEQ